MRAFGALPSARDVSVSQLALRLVVALVVLFLVAPIAIIIPVSLTSDPFLRFPPSGLSLQWYSRVLGRQEWISALWISMQVATLSTLFTLLLGVPAALALVRGRFRARSMVFPILLSPLAVPVIVTAVASYFFFARLGMVGNVVAMALGHTVVALPLVVTITAATLQGFDWRLEQAAISLGASPLQAFRRVTLPGVAPGVVSAALLAFLTSFDELMIPLFLGGTTTQTLAVRIWNSVLFEIEPTVAAVSAFLILVSSLTLAAARLLLRPRAPTPPPA